MMIYKLILFLVALVGLAGGVHAMDLDQQRFDFLTMVITAGGDSLICPDIGFRRLSDEMLDALADNVLMRGSYQRLCNLELRGRCPELNDILTRVLLRRCGLVGDLQTAHHNMNPAFANYTCDVARQFTFVVVAQKKSRFASLAEAPIQSKQRIIVLDRVIGRRVGYINFVIRHGHAEIECVHVDICYRRQHVGTALLFLALRLIDRQLGLAPYTVSLRVTAYEHSYISYEQLVHFFESFGFSYAQSDIKFYQMTLHFDDHAIALTPGSSHDRPVHDNCTVN